jgi:hypothetical protein
MYTFPGNFHSSSIPSQFAHLGLFMYHPHSLLPYLVLTYLLGTYWWQPVERPYCPQRRTA